MWSREIRNKNLESDEWQRGRDVILVSCQQLHSRSFWKRIDPLSELPFAASGGVWNLAKTKFLATSDDESRKLIATEPINAGSGIALADGESYDVTMTLAGEP